MKGCLLLIMGVLLSASTVSAQSYVWRGNSVVRPQTVIDGSVVVIRGNLDVYGTIRGDATALRGNIVVHRGGRITRDARAVLGTVQAPRNAIGGEVKVVASKVVHRHVARTGSVRHGTLHSIGVAISWWLVSLLAGYVVLLTAADKIDVVVNTVRQGVGKSLGIGILGYVGLAPGLIGVVLLLAVSIVGILLIPLAAVGYVVAVTGAAMFGFVAVAVLTGAAITGRNKRDETPSGALLRAFVTGTSVYVALWLIAALFTWAPLFGAALRSFASAVTFVAVTAGFGAVIRSYWTGAFGKRPLPAE